MNPLWGVVAAAFASWEDDRRKREQDERDKRVAFMTRHGVSLPIDPLARGEAYRDSPLLYRSIYGERHPPGSLRATQGVVVETDAGPSQRANTDLSSGHPHLSLSAATGTATSKTSDGEWGGAALPTGRYRKAYPDQSGLGSAGGGKGPPWSDVKPVVVLMLLVVWPLGLYMLWKSNAFGAAAKWLITAGYVVVFALLFAVPDSKSRHSATGQAHAAHTSASTT